MLLLLLFEQMWGTGGSAAAYACRLRTAQVSHGRCPCVDPMQQVVWCVTAACLQLHVVRLGCTQLVKPLWIES